MLHLGGFGFLESERPQRHGMHLFQSDMALAQWGRQLWLW